jgi:hypothetical protein
MSAIIFSGDPTTTQNKVPIADLPTLERLLLWALFVFNRLNSSRDIFLSEGSGTKQASYNRFLGNDGTLYLGFTVFVAVDKDYEVSTDQPWELAIEQNTAVVSPKYNGV